MAVNWGEVALYAGIVAPSVILHEISHGVVALHFGDDTAKRAGRLTLNPAAHIDPLGTIVLPVLLAAGGLGVIGYAKPVPVNVRKLRKPRDHALLVSLAGPATNLLLAVLAAVVFRALGGFDRGFDSKVVEVAYYVGLFNVLLALFNLLPLPPLDGSAVIERLLPKAWWPTWIKLRRYSFGVLIVLFLVLGMGDVVVEPAIRVWGWML